MSYPILYDASATSFNNLGLGVAIDTTEAKVTEELNGRFELDFTYLAKGSLASNIKNDTIVKVDTGDQTDQLFRIKSVTSTIKGELEAHCEHVSYLTNDLAIKPTWTATQVDGPSVLKAWLEAIVDKNPLTVYSDVTTTSTSTWSVPDFKCARDILGGVNGSILDNWGGEYQFDNYQVRLYRQRGKVSNTIIAYGRNLTDFEQEASILSTYTSVYPVAIENVTDTTDTTDTTDASSTQHTVLHTLPELVVDSSHINSYPNRRSLLVDFSQQFDDKNTYTDAKLRTLAQQYIKNNDVGIPDVTMTITTVDLSQMIDDSYNVVQVESLHLADTVNVYFDALNINTTAKVVASVWNVLLDSYDQYTVGAKKADMGTMVNNSLAEIKQIADTANQHAIDAVQSADGKNTNYYGNSGDGKPANPKVGDLYFEKDGDDTNVYRWDGSSWVEIISTKWQETFENSLNAVINSEMAQLDISLAANSAAQSSLAIALNSNDAVLSSAKTALSNNANSLTNLSSTMLSASTVAASGLASAAVAMASNSAAQTSLSTALISLKATDSSLSNTMSSASSALVNNNSSLASLNTALTSNASALTVNNTSLASMNTKLTSASTALTINNTSLSSLSTAMTSASNVLINNSSQLASASSAFISASSSLASLNAALTNNSSALAVNNTSLASMNTKLSSASTALTTNQNSLNSASTALLNIASSVLTAQSTATVASNVAANAVNSAFDQVMGAINTNNLIINPKFQGINVGSFLTANKIVNGWYCSGSVTVLAAESTAPSELILHCNQGGTALNNFIQVKQGERYVLTAEVRASQITTKSATIEARGYPANTNFANLSSLGTFTLNMYLNSNNAVNGVILSNQSSGACVANTWVTQSFTFEIPANVAYLQANFFSESGTFDYRRISLQRVAQGQATASAEPALKTVGLTWKYTGSSALLASDGTSIQPNTIYQWNGTNWVLYVLESVNLHVQNGYINNAMIGNAQITGNLVAKGAITGDLVAANTIDTSKLVVGDPNNYAVSG